MKNLLLSALAVLATLLSTIPAQADAVADRTAKITQIIEAQGVRRMLQQQLEQSQKIAKEIGNDVYKKLLAEKGIAQDKADPRLEKIFEKHMERSTSLFTADELTERWIKAYGNDLTDTDLDTILAYYRSSAGQKEVQANLATSEQFAKNLSLESKRRFKAVVDQLLIELNAITTPNSLSK